MGCLKGVNVSTAVRALVTGGGGHAVQYGSLAVGGGQAFTGQLWLGGGAAEVAHEARALTQAFGLVLAIVEGADGGQVHVGVQR